MPLNNLIADSSRVPGTGLVPSFRASQIVLALAGAGLIALVVIGIGPALVWRQVVALRRVLAVLVAMGAVKHMLRTLAWQRALTAEGISVGFSHLLRIRIAAQGTAHLAGLDLLVSEPLKPWLLREVATVEATLPPTLLEASLYWVTSLLVATIGTLVALAVMVDSHMVDIRGTLTIVIVSVVTFAGVFLLVFARKPHLPALAAWAARRRAIPPKWSAFVAKAGEIEARMRSFRLRHPATVASLLGFNLLVQVVMLAEVWLVLTAVGAATGFSQLVMIEAASRIVKMMSFYLPARVGADEAGAAGSFALLGLNPAAGIALALGRRVQALTWAAAGLLWLAGARVSPRLTSDTEKEAADASCRLAPQHF